MSTPVSRSEVVDIAQYEKIRAEFRAQLLAIKENRQVLVGEYFHFLFENHQTVLYQIQEMLRVERIVEEGAIAHEIKTYNELIPPPGGLAATLLIEYEDEALRNENLPRLLGIQDHVWLRVGEQSTLKAEFNLSQIGETRISSVQYMTFPLTGEQRGDWMEVAREGKLHLAIDHPHFSHHTPISPEVAEALALDFQ